ncbi:hypothetical protein M2159_008575 [Streptomyces sp. SAI-090]|nr:hypothetical protein [Streptomyces sp. SAI-090]
MIDRRHVLSTGAALGTTMLLPGTAVAASATELGTLHRRLVVGRAQFRSARYANLAETLPGLLRDARAAQARTTGARRQAASVLLARVHILASERAVKSGDSGEAWDHARSAVAAGESSGNVFVLAEATRVCATPLRRQGRAADAVLLLQDMITTLAGDASSAPEPQLVSATGSLALTAAYSAALEGRRTTALSLMDMAADATARLARAPQAYAGGLTTGQVQLYQVGVHHLLGDDIAAVRAAERLRPFTLPTARTPGQARNRHRTRTDCRGGLRACAHGSARSGGSRLGRGFPAVGPCLDPGATRTAPSPDRFAGLRGTHRRRAAVIKAPAYPSGTRAGL